MHDDVVITGIGLTCAAGLGLDALADRLQAGRGAATAFETALPVTLACQAPDPVPDDAFPDDRKAWLAFAALELALADAGLAAVEPDRRTAVFLGTGLSSVTPGELEDDAYPHIRDGRFDVARVASDLSPRHASPWRHMPERVTDEVARRVGATGPVGTSFSACAAAAQAIAEGLWTLRRGDADVAIVGGHDSMVHPLGLLSFVVLGALSPGACRPFDRERDGFLIGEGASLLVLERASHARARGATVRARLLGAGTSVDAWNATAPHPEGAGAERSIRAALRDAGVAAADIEYLNAHATGTPVGDVAEAAAVARVFGEGLPVSSIKGAVGHTIAAAGAVEAAACVAALERGFLPGTEGLCEQDPECRVDAITAPRAVAPRLVLSNSFGFGGQNASLVLARA
ncbi:MAG: beta-ketoacyl-[acyl-carrier-protein] synthase family protein [Alphaproteobacteria bacterium]|nr:beta-ketoacyl-[acyl-carrier-protein] synthase family protein [Alphaproteobacteria bacterium]